MNVKPPEKYRIAYARPALACALLLASTAMQAAEPAPKVLRTLRVDTAPVVDGELDDAVWAQAEPIFFGLHSVTGKPSPGALVG